MHERYELMDRPAGTRLLTDPGPAFENLDDVSCGGVIALLSDRPERVSSGRGPGRRLVSLV